MAISETRKRFNNAFREARGDGVKTFMFEGKKYTTDMAPARPTSSTDTGDESDRLSRRYAAPEKPKAEYDRSVPSPDAGKDVREPTKASSMKSGLMDTAGKVLGAAGLTGGAMAAGRMLGKRIASKQAEGIMSSAGKRASETRGQMARDAAKDARAAKNADEARYADEGNPNYARGGKVKAYASGGVVKSSASRRGDGIAKKGKTKGKMC
jgi:hypothetical protein